MDLNTLLNKTLDQKPELILLENFNNSLDGMAPFVSGQVYAIRDNNQVKQLQVNVCFTAQCFRSEDMYDYSNSFTFDLDKDLNIKKILLEQQRISLAELESYGNINSQESQFIVAYSGEDLISDDLLNEHIHEYSSKHNGIHGTFFAYQNIESVLNHLLFKIFS